MTDDTSGFGPFSVDALLDGDDVRDDALGELLAALKSAPVPAELDGESAAVAAIAVAIPAPTAVAATSSGIRRLTTRTGALAAVGALAFTGVAAAATGVPVPVVEELFNNNDGPTLVEEILEEDVPSSETDSGLETDGATDDEGSSDTSADGASDKTAEGSVDADDANQGDIVSDAAHSDCGKPAKAGPKDGDADVDTDESELEDGAAVDGAGLEPALPDDECDARNHGEHVSETAKDNAGRANSNDKGQGNGKGQGNADADDDAASVDEGKNGASSENGNRGGNGQGNGNASGGANANGDGADD